MDGGFDHVFGIFERIIDDQQRILFDADGAQLYTGIKVQPDIDAHFATLPDLRTGRQNKIGMLAHETRLAETPRKGRASPWNAYALHRSMSFAD
jgi:hypothetical protein